MANSNGIDKMNKQANEIVDERIEKLKRNFKRNATITTNPSPL